MEIENYQNLVIAGVEASGPELVMVQARFVEPKIAHYTHPTIAEGLGPLFTHVRPRATT